MVSGSGFGIRGSGSIPAWELDRLGGAFVPHREHHHQPHLRFGLRVSGFEFRDSNFGIRISGLGFREHHDLPDLEFGTHGCRVQVGSPTHHGTSAGFRVPGSGLGWVPGSGFQFFECSGFRGSGSGFNILGVGFHVSGSIFRVSGAGLRDQGVRVQKDNLLRIDGWSSVATPHASETNQVIVDPDSGFRVP